MWISLDHWPSFKCHMAPPTEGWDLPGLVLATPIDILSCRAKKERENIFSFGGRVYKKQIWYLILNTRAPIKLTAVLGLVTPLKSSLYFVGFHCIQLPSSQVGLELMNAKISITQKLLGYDRGYRGFKWAPVLYPNLNDVKDRLMVFITLSHPNSPCMAGSVHCPGQLTCFLWRWMSSSRSSTRSRWFSVQLFLCLHQLLSHRINSFLVVDEYTVIIHSIMLRL